MLIGPIGDQVEFRISLEFESAAACDAARLPTMITIIDMTDGALEILEPLTCTPSQDA